MAKAEGPSWKGGSIYISFKNNADLGAGSNSQEWTAPVLLLDKPERIIWYPSLQSINSPATIEIRHTSVLLGQKARLAGGGQLSLYKTDHTLSSLHGKTPLCGQIYLHINPGKMK